MILVYDLNYNLVKKHELLTVKGVKNHHYPDWFWGPCFTISDNTYGMAYLQKASLSLGSSLDVILLDTHDYEFTINNQYAKEYFPYGITLLKRWARENSLNQLGI